MERILPYLFVVILVGCASDKSKSQDAYFGGEVVNPTSNYVVLYKGDKVIDSAKLDSQNRFMFHLDTVDEGLHHFDHTPEMQYVYLAKGDSLMVRLNTVDFDESLAFSGRGEELNNFMLDRYLDFEREESYINTLYRDDPSNFEHKMDSLRDQKLEMLSNLKEEAGLDDKQMEVAKASIVYNYFICQEKYPFVHQNGEALATFEKLPQNFYNYRKWVNLNDADLVFYRPYYNYMKCLYGNLSFIGCKKECDVLANGEKNYLHLYEHKLHLIDSMVSQKDLRDNLFRNVAMDYLLKHEDSLSNQAFITELHQLNSGNKHMAEIDGLYNAIQKIAPNKELPDVAVYCTEGKKTYLKDIAKGKGKRVVFYFWSASQKGHFENICKRVKDLEKRYPKTEFVGINMKTDSLQWLTMMESGKLDKSKQYRAKDNEAVAHALVVYDSNKGIVAEDGHVIDGFANLFTTFK